MGALTVRAALAALLAGVLCACGPAAPAPTAPAFSRTLDLTHVVREDVPHPPGEPPTRLIRAADGRLVALSIGARTGSLVQVVAAPGSAPSTVEELSPRDLVLPAVMIDARDLAQDGPGFALSEADVLAWEQIHGAVPRGAMVLVATGWDVRWGEPEAYLNLGPGASGPTPGLSPAAADLLLNQRGAAGLGLDAPAPPYAPAAGFRLLLANLTSLEQLPPTGAMIVVGALKLQAAQASPARVLALIP